MFRKISGTVSIIIILFIQNAPVSHCQDINPKGWETMHSPVSYHLSFDDDEFFKEDIIEQSGKKSLEERNIKFPLGKFGQGISMSEIPTKPDVTNMTGIDLDLVTAVIFNTNPGNQMGFNQPFIWGSGRINARLGGVAFWARGELAFAGPLFEQTSVGFGRKERDLLGILVDDANILSAYVRDARYQTHVIESETVWDPDKWNHIVLNWDWANGLELWINGKIIASSWGEDAWFETTLPGLFHLPAAGLTYDELYLFDRPLTATEIKRLRRSNKPPDAEASVYLREKINIETIRRLSGANTSQQLPKVQPNQLLRFTETWPEQVSDGHIPGWYVVDGRNEIAWPHPYSMFTIIPGDADFHAEKVDLTTSSSSKVNYVILTGNLTNVKFQASTPSSVEMDELFSVPDGDLFQYGSSVTLKRGATFRLPFTESYGTPQGFSGDINVPLSGEKRVQNIGLYYVDRPGIHSNVLDGRKLTLSTPASSLDPKMKFAFQALTSRDERNVAIASESPPKMETAINVGNFSRLNILCDPAGGNHGIKSITLRLPIRTEENEEVLYLKVRDPAVPSRIWNQIMVKLSGFDGSFRTLLLEIDFQDIVVADADRIWLDLGSAGSTEILIGSEENAAAIYVEEIQTYRAIDAYASKEMVSAKAQYSKMYEFMPWQFTGKSVTLDDPYCYGGPFDMLLPALAVKKLKPNHFLANYMVRMCSLDFRDGKPVDPAKMPLITLPNPQSAPEWALYMQDFNKKRHEIADWWANKQNADGQLGGGWNDDVLFMSFHQADLPLDGNQNARYLIDATHKGLEATNYFKDGFCNIYPMDRMHIGDFISERYNSLVNNLGQAYAFERELESAWRLEDQEKTPVNYYADGFKSSVNVFNWYWGKDVPQSAYESKSLKELAQEFRRYTSVLDEYSFYRFTESNVHRDDYSPFGSNNMYTYMLGGQRGTRLDAHLKLAVMWPSGGGPKVARVVLFADESSLRVAAYSFHNSMRELKLRLCRIEAGKYRIRIHEDPNGTGESGKVLWEEEKELHRFDIINLPIPQQTAVLISVQQLTELNEPAMRPDLAIDIWDAEYENGKVSCVIHNLGDAQANKISVRLYDGETIISEQIIEQLLAPVDFLAKRKELVFEDVVYSENLKILVDPANEISEILEENNSTFVNRKGTYEIGLAPKDKE